MSSRLTIAMNTGFFLVALLMIPAYALATAQYPDKIIYKGKEYRLHTNPMEAFFEKHPNRRPEGGVISSALWRGYVATFEISNGSLVLRDIEIEVPNPDKEHDYVFKSVLEKVVPRGEILTIDWFSGLLVLPQGKVVNYVHMGYGSTFERYTLLAVKNGIFNSERKFTFKEYEAFKDRQFRAFKKTEEYKRLVADLKKDRDVDDRFIDDFLRSFITSYTSEFLDN